MDTLVLHQYSSMLLAGSYFGPVLAPVITIAIVNAFNWQAVFYMDTLVLHQYRIRNALNIINRDV
jgi:hypothetical protein